MLNVKTHKPCDVLLDKAASYGVADLKSPDFTSLMDKNDPLKPFRSQFYMPKRQDSLDADDSDNDVIYLCGHSLGLQPKITEKYIQRVLIDWRNYGVESHTEGFLPAASCENYCKSLMASLVGCEPNDLVIMNGLTVNLHIMMTYFYKPTLKRHKILMEYGAFSSDLYAAKSQLNINGFNSSSLISLKPRENEHLLRIEDILQVLDEQGDEIELVLWPGVQYYTGQSFDVELIINTAKTKGCKIGLDLAHSVGNVPVNLAKWKPDFAVWCTYKYLNAGPGGFGAAYVNRKYTSHENYSKFLNGWWGNDSKTRFEMKRDFEPAEGADMFKLSNQSPVLAAMLLASLETFEEAGFENLLQKQFLLTGYMEFMIRSKLSTKIEILTSSNPQERGNQLSISLINRKYNAKTMGKELLNRGIMCDFRPPSVLRFATCPLYNNFTDVRKFVDILADILEPS